MNQQVLTDNGGMSGAPPKQFKRQELMAAGFQGFVTFDELRRGRISAVPSGPGAYVVLREIDEMPAFLPTSVGGWFKGKNPTEDRAVLTSKWVLGAHGVYIGKGDELQRRLRQYMNFGAGKPIGHWGGRYIWQLEDSASLVVAWRSAPTGMSGANLETLLLQRFLAIYNRLPFANLRN